MAGGEGVGDTRAPMGIAPAPDSLLSSEPVRGTPDMDIRLVTFPDRGRETR